VARDDHHPGMPLFFLSYARAGSVSQTNGPRPGSNGQVDNFFGDLSVNVAELVHRRPGADPGFMDNRSMKGGARWTEELLHAVGSCQVFVALLSAPYVSSEWCGMEWYAFSRRKVTKLEESAFNPLTCIIPVAWAPVLGEQIPPCVDEVQRFSPDDLPDPDMARRYETDGVFGLLRMRQEIPYQAVVWRLAQRIAEIYHSHSVEPRTFDRAELRNIFQQQDVRNNL
jgi:TIR domain